MIKEATLALANYNIEIIVTFLERLRYEHFQLNELHVVDETYADDENPKEE